jgi:NADPH:quinone reductase-like Zn-dependent oxidoreductase
MLFKYPKSVKDEHAALAEPASVCVRAVRKSRLASGETVVVVGAGTIGLLTMQAAKAWGASKVMVVEVEASRRALAMELGAAEAINPLERDAVAAVQRLTGGIGADASGGARAPSGHACRQSWEARGYVCGPTTSRADQLVSVVMKELIGSFSHVYDDFSSPSTSSHGAWFCGYLITARIPMMSWCPGLTTGVYANAKILVSPQTQTGDVSADSSKTLTLIYQNRSI